MYSLPTSTTFAAFTIASAASTAPTNPLVSIIPSASIFIENIPPPKAILLSFERELWREIHRLTERFKLTKTDLSRQAYFVIAPLKLRSHCATPIFARCVNVTSKMAFHGLVIISKLEHVQ